jgi:hypothetical protein
VPLIRISELKILIINIKLIMSYSEILNPQNRILTQFNRHATLAIGESSVVAGQTVRAIVLPINSCLATDRAYISLKNASAANANDAPLRSAVITVNAGVPTLTVTLAAIVAAADVEFYYVIMRSAN